MVIISLKVCQIQRHFQEKVELNINVFVFYNFPCLEVCGNAALRCSNAKIDHYMWYGTMSCQNVQAGLVLYRSHR